MADVVDEAISSAEPRELGLKELNTKELEQLLLDGHNWTAEERQRVNQAFTFADHFHRDQLYKDEPYINHPLRVANRIVGYLELQDADLIVGALLHDIIEDHAAEIVRWKGAPPIDDAVKRYGEARSFLADWFGSRVGHVLQAVTNPPDLLKAEAEAEKLAAYASKVAEATSTTDGWLVKFCDWCDNAVGLYMSEMLAERKAWSAKKYLAAWEVLAARFEDEDVQAVLSPSAYTWASEQLALGAERLRAMLAEA